MNGLCTPGVVYPQKMGVHHVYMSKKAKRGQQPTRMRTWVKDRKTTYQAISDHLAELKPPIKFSRNSVGRVAAGKQNNTKYSTLSAIAAYLRTDVTKMFTMTPEEAGDVMEFEAMPPNERKRVLRINRAAKEE